ncbi:pyridoxal-phosphate dependent enzyme [Actinocrispum wychmicini]|uniref:Diaminopropionate ammonia-lyase n=1 Tax=Actinocrispum wychmicini TaxID=1213861 RepID=A0A4R2KEP2_9PSEU|nr:pyridoxal-phosphate dependent enzyme [Actinocrispum wychmicini]TCO65015.1 diaminopropionate ammonia-lyase [Actinocrispum wychmicini]
MYLNPTANTWSAPPHPQAGDPLELHRTLPGFMPTPLLEAPALARELNVKRVLVKDEHLRAGLPSFKILGASWAIFRALGGVTGGFADIDVDPETTLVSATAGNHGRAVAYVARLLGVGADIFIPAGTAPARVEAIRSEGANVHLVDGDYEVAVGKATAHAHGKALLVGDVGESMTPLWAREGYSTIMREIDEQLGAPDLVVVPVGGGTLGSSVVSHYRTAGPRPRILTVEPEKAGCLAESLAAGRPVAVPGPHPSTMAGLNTGEIDGPAWPYLKGGVDAAVTISDEEAHWGMRALADENIVAGECGAASAAGARAYFAAGDPLGVSPAATVVLINTEGAHDQQAYDKIVSR